MKSLRKITDKVKLKVIFYVNYNQLVRMINYSVIQKRVALQMEVVYSSLLVRSQQMVSYSQILLCSYSGYVLFSSIHKTLMTISIFYMYDILKVSQLSIQKSVNDIKKKCLGVNVAKSFLCSLRITLCESRRVRIFSLLSSHLLPMFDRLNAFKKSN